MDLLIEWGYLGLFIAAFVAGSIVPFSSEVVMFALIKINENAGHYDTVIWCVLVATLGNTLGSLTCYFIGYIGKKEWVTKYLKVEPDKIERAKGYIQRKGAWLAVFCFLPFIGEALAIALGFLKSNPYSTAIYMFVGKFIRYLAIYYFAEWGISLFNLL